MDARVIWLASHTVSSCAAAYQYTACHSFALAPFAPGKARLLADSHALLLEIVDVLVKNRLALIRIEGHTDNKGSAKFNKKLSEERAHAVLEYLVAQGVDRAHLESQGFGGSRPVAPNLTPRGRELNRRVDFIVLKR